MNESPALTAAPKNYTLTSDLAQYCLPAANRDEYRKFAWANSICFLVLIIGLIGLKQRKIEIKELPVTIDVVPVVFLPPEEPPSPPEPTVEPEVTEPSPVDVPQVATVVAPAATAAFPVPVEGPVVLAPSARFAQAPPAAPPRSATRPQATVLSGGDCLSCPTLTSYPAYAQQQRYQGTVILEIEVLTNGPPTSVEIKETSGHNILDRTAVDWVKKRWRLRAGRYTQDFVFTLPK